MQKDKPFEFNRRRYIADYTASLRSYYFDIATSIYKWKGLPEEIPKRYPERWLYDNGMCVFFEVPSQGYAILPVQTERIEKNLYGEPCAWGQVAVGQYSGEVAKLKLDETNSVLMRNNPSYTPTRPYIDQLIREMVNVEFTTRMNINAQKNPMWFKSSEETVLRDKNTFVEWFECEPVQFRDKLDMDFEFINPNIPFTQDKLADLYNVYDYRILTYLGLDNPGVDKKERLIVSENESNNDKLLSMRNARLEYRELAQEKINELFGLNVSVQVDEDLIPSVNTNEQEKEETETVDNEGGN